jgi:citrate lyase subunit beta-like protein
VDDSEVLQFLDGFLEAYELRNNIKKESIKLIAIIESAKSFLNLKEICTATKRLDALVFGAEDFAVDVGAIRTETNREVLYARSQMLMYAAAYKLDAIDMVCNDYKHLKKLKKEAEDGAELGYSGKQVIHPDQIEIVNNAFSPKMEDIMKARKIVTDYESQLVVGKGAISVEGSLVDQPVYKQSKSLLEKVALIEKYSKEITRNRKKSS